MSNTYIEPLLCAHPCASSYRVDRKSIGMVPHLKCLQRIWGIRFTYKNNYIKENVLSWIIQSLGALALRKEESKCRLGFLSRTMNGLRFYST